MILGIDNDEEEHCLSDSIICVPTPCRCCKSDEEDADELPSSSLLFELDRCSAVLSAHWRSSKAWARISFGFDNSPSSLGNVDLIPRFVHHSAGKLREGGV